MDKSYRECDTNTFMCRTCDKLFTKKKNRKRHEEEVHGQKKSYECKICHSKFGRKSDLKKHEKKYHSSYGRSTAKQFVKIPEYSDISDCELPSAESSVGDHNNNDPSTSTGNYATEDDFKNLESMDFLNMTDQEYSDIKKDMVVEEDIKTVTLSLTRTVTKTMDGTIKVKKEATVGFTENVDKDKVSVRDIVNQVATDVNDYFMDPNKVPPEFYSL